MCYAPLFTGLRAQSHIQYDNCYAVNKTDFVDDYPPIQEEVMSTF